MPFLTSTEGVSYCLMGVVSRLTLIKVDFYCIICINSYSRGVNTHIMKKLSTNSNPLTPPEFLFHPHFL